MTGIAEVNQILAAEKSIVRPMSWTPKLKASEACWHQYESAVSDTSSLQTMEGLLVRCLWRPKICDRPGVFVCGLFAEIASRIYAIDVGPMDDHTNNKAGRGRPFWGKHVGGIHEHTWSSDGGYGYAEPIEGVTIDDPEGTWREFCKRANLQCAEPFVHPDPSVNAGQGGLFP